MQFHSFFSTFISFFLEFSFFQRLKPRSTLLAAVNEVTKVQIDCRGVGEGELSASVIGQETKTSYPVAVRDTGDLTYEITYSVPSAGVYELAIKHDDIHISGSPFIVTGYIRTHPEEVGMIFSCLLHEFYYTYSLLYIQSIIIILTSIYTILSSRRPLTLL